LIRPFLAFSEVRHPVWHCTVFIQVLNGRINNSINVSAAEAAETLMPDLFYSGG
jgi:hypothetical protein